MKKKVVLPLEKSPLVCCYHNMAFPLGIIQGNANELKKDITPWIIAKYLNCIFIDDSPYSKYEICLYDWWGLEDQIVRHQHANMYTYMYNKMGIDLIKCIKVALQEGCYITGLFNEKHIPGKSSYQKKDYIHDYMIYGYNSKQKVFCSIGYLCDGSYSTFEIPYENYLNSIIDSPSNRIEYDLWKFNSDYQFKLDINRIFNGFRDYIDSTNGYGLRNNCCYGIAANKKLKEYLQQCAFSCDDPWVDIRYTRAFMEHKYFIQLCIKYLHEEKIIILDESELKLVEDIYQKGRIIYMLSLKYNVLHNDRIIKNIIKHFECLEEIENVIINKVINSIDNYWAE